MQLQGVRVIDLTRILSGPFCSLLLADMGAEVIKVEPPGGDPLRGQGAIVEGLSWYFAAFNRNKRSIVLNLRHASGRAALRRLIATGDVVVENFRPGVMAGLYAALGTVAALYRRVQTGQGEQVGVAMVDGLISLGAFLTTNFFTTGQPPVPTGNDHTLVAPYGLFTAQDGELAIAPSNDGVYAKLLTALDLETLHEHAEFRTNDLRVQHRGAINALINARIAQAPKAYWIEGLNAAGVPCGVVMKLAEVFADSQVISQEMVLAIPHSGHGTVKMTGFPLKFREAPSTVRYPAPELGAHTASVLRVLGYSDAEIADQFSVPM